MTPFAVLREKDKANTSSDAAAQSTVQMLEFHNGLSMAHLLSVIAEIGVADQATLSELFSSAMGTGMRRLIDIGGAHSHLVAAIPRRYPEMKGLVFDLPM